MFSLYLNLHSQAVLFSPGGCTVNAVSYRYEALKGRVIKQPHCSLKSTVNTENGVVLAFR